MYHTLFMQVVEEYSGTPYPRPRILGLTAPLVPGPGGAEPGRLEAEIKQLESTLNCTAETASDIVSVLRYEILSLITLILI